MAEAWRSLKPGDRVRVARGISETERRLAGREFVIDRFTKPHGYAVIMDEHGPWWVHPEALERIEWHEGWPQDPGDHDERDPMLELGSDFGTGNE